jgi:TonB-linked SusC/RagA family outer membrane protein
MKQILLSTLLSFVAYNYCSSQGERSIENSDSVLTENISQKGNLQSPGAASIYTSDDFNRGVIFTPMQLIQGKVPGMAISGKNGNDPNPILQIQLRGTSTLMLNTEPLYVIDGIPVESPDLILPQNIESIQVLKNLSETAPFGIRGANGVVLIKSKKDHSKVLSVNYSTYGYITTFSKKSDYLTASEWRQLKNDWSTTQYNKISNHNGLMKDYNNSTDWRKEISQNKLSQVHNVGITGGYKKTSYAASLNYSNHNGIIKKSQNNIMGGQLYISQLALKDKLQVGISFTGSSRKYKQINENPYLNSTGGSTYPFGINLLSYANAYNPTVSVYKSDGTYGLDSLLYINPVEKLANTTDKRSMNNQLAYLQASYEIIKGLKISTSYTEYMYSFENSFSKIYTANINDYTQGSNESNKRNEKLYGANLNYIKQVGNHHLNLLLGYTNQTIDRSYNYKDSTISSNSLVFRNSEELSKKYDIIGISGSAKYNFKNKYFFMVTLLQEESPLFSNKINKSFFPSFSAAWSISKEKFMDDLKWLNEFTVHIGYGLGRRSLSGEIFNDYGVIRKSSISGEDVTRDVIPNPELHGENMKELNFGSDLAFFSDRVCFSLEHYKRETKDVVIYEPIPVGYGYSGILTNTPKIQNKGWEFNLTAQPVINPVNWVINFNFSFNKNEVLSAKEYYYTIGEGQPVGKIIGGRFAGYSADDDVMMYDDNGNATSNWNTGFFSSIGSGAPKMFFGFGNTFKYNSFELSVFARGALGFEIKNSDKLDYLNQMNYKKESITVDQRDLINYDDLLKTDYVIEKGDYLKIDNITLGYSLPLKKRYLQSAKIYIACNSVATFTKFTGGDPEMAGITGTTPGNYYSASYPNTRIYILGLKVIL